MVTRRLNSFNLEDIAVKMLAADMALQPEAAALDSYHRASQDAHAVTDPLRRAWTQHGSP